MKTKISTFIQLNKPNSKNIRYFMHGTDCEKGFSGVIIDYTGGGNWDEFYYINGINLEEELIENNQDEWFDQDEIIKVFIEKKGKEFYEELERTQNNIMDWGENYEPILKKNPPKDTLAYESKGSRLRPINVGNTIFGEKLPFKS